jgi:hypothetical protein
MTAPPDRDAEIVALLAEIAALRARVEALESMVFGATAAAMPPDEAGPEEATRLEAPEPWNLGPPGRGGAEP